MNLDYAKQITKDVDGWLTDKESALLYNTASQLTGKGIVVEIGSWQGKSTIFIATGLLNSKSKELFYAVDPHVGSEEHQSKEGAAVWTYDSFLKNIKNAGVSERVTPVVETSVAFGEKCTHPVEFVFIDGAHDVVSVEKDFETWFSKLVEGGSIAFHDTYAGGDPYRVLRNKLYCSRQVGIIHVTDSITYTKKTRRNSILVYLYNMCLMKIKDARCFLYRYVFFRKAMGYLKNFGK